MSLLLGRTKQWSMRSTQFILASCLVFAAIINQLPLVLENGQLRGALETRRSIMSVTRGSRPSIAVCISGMPERLQPWHAFEHLIAANMDRFQFDVIYALGEHSKLTYSSRPDATFEPTRYAHYKTTQELTDQLHADAKTFGIDFDESARTQLHILPFIPDLSRDDWLQRMDVPDLDRITQYVDNGIQTNILNMYHHQVECASHIERLEEARGARFDWIINTREDAFYFSNVNLDKLISENDDDTCDLVTKNCLDFEGINMRFQLLRRRGLNILKSRLDFYKGMYHGSSGITTIRNPEQFEREQLKQSNIQVCKLPVSDVPVNVARHTSNGDFCFLPYEVQGCVPPEFVHFVNRKRCYPFEWKPNLTNI